MPIGARLLSREVWSGNQTPVFGQISEFRVQNADQGDLLFAAPVFYLLLPGNGVPDIVCLFGVDEPPDVVSGGKAVNHFSAMLNHASREVIGDARVEGGEG